MERRRAKTTNQQPRSGLWWLWGRVRSQQRTDGVDGNGAQLQVRVRPNLDVLLEREEIYASAVCQEQQKDSQQNIGHVEALKHKEFKVGNWRLEISSWGRSRNLQSRICNLR